jgi:DNA-binding NarL/FixJ family response regulator
MHLLLVTCGSSPLETWQAVGEQYGIRVTHSPARVNQLRLLVAQGRPEWILIAETLDDLYLERLVSCARGIRPALGLAMVGPTDDTARCDRWIRRGCLVYMSDTATREQLLATVEAAYRLRLVCIERLYTFLTAATRLDPIPKLTRRERDVLDLLSAGMRNSEIGAALGVAEKTVEFHVSNLLNKIEARNRLELARLASRWGLT